MEKNLSFLVKIDNEKNIHVPLLDQNAEFCSQRKFKLIGVQYVVTWNFVLSPSGFKETWTKFEDFRSEVIKLLAIHVKG